MNFKEKEMSTRDLGRYFGYPECCIDYFHKRNDKRNDKKNDKKNDKEKSTSLSSSETGFIPCPSCANKIIIGEVKIEDLICNRECETVFPNDNGMRITYRRLRLRLKIILMKKLHSMNEGEGIYIT